MVSSILRSSHLVLYISLRGLAFAVGAILIRSSDHSWGSTEWENPSRTKEGKEKRVKMVDCPSPFPSSVRRGSQLQKQFIHTSKMLVTEGYRRVSRRPKDRNSCENNLWKIQTCLLISEYVKITYIRRSKNKTPTQLLYPRVHTQKRMHV